MSFDFRNTASLGDTGHPVNTDTFYHPFSVRVKLQGEWVQVFGAMISGIISLDKRYLWLVNGFLEYHPPIITNTCPPKWSQKSLRLKVVSFLPRKSFWSGELGSACYDALEWCDHLTESYWAILLRGTVFVTENKFLSLWMKSFKCVTTQMKASELKFPVILFATQQKVWQHFHMILVVLKALFSIFRGTVLGTFLGYPGD